MVHWYNNKHHHSAIGFVTPSQLHAGLDAALLQDRAKVYELARQAKQLSWSNATRDWSRVDCVHLNLDKPISDKDIEDIKLVA
jgi:hypothetical protein